MSSTDTQDVSAVRLEGKMIGRGFLYTGVALILASAIRGLLDMLRADTFEPWSIVLALGCILASIGLGLTGLKPWEKIQEKSEEISSRFQ
jgi:hypothetical protein